jgi:vacuolar-type H+-ATPase catalytic subunit A/Vma1
MGDIRRRKFQSDNSVNNHKRVVHGLTETRYAKRETRFAFATKHAFRISNKESKMGQIVDDVKSLLDYKKDKQAAETARQKILAQIKADEKQKTNLVKKALAAQRAKYGAGGSTGKTMTDEAVLKRLRDEAAEPFAEKKTTNEEKLRAIKTKKPNILKSLLSGFDQLL